SPGMMSWPPQPMPRPFADACGSLPALGEKERSGACQRERAATGRTRLTHAGFFFVPLAGAAGDLRRRGGEAVALMQPVQRGHQASPTRPAPSPAWFAASRCSSPRASREDRVNEAALQAMQRPCAAFRVQLNAYQTRFVPTHATELLLTTPARL